MSKAVSHNLSGSARHHVFNVPNQLSFLRLILAVGVFVALSFEGVTAARLALVLFVLGAVSDALDGYIARRFNMVTTLGRILDPFVDKVIVCGTFVFLVAADRLTSRWYLLQPWMVVVILGRELLVTALRGFIEQQGGDFSARLSGKLKMVLQCVAATLGLVILALPTGSLAEQLTSAFAIFLWLAVAATVYSGAVYVVAAVQISRRILGGEHLSE